MWEKRTVWELGTRVPFMVYVPWMTASHGRPAKRAVIFLGGGIFLISSGSPHVLRAHTGALNTCGEPNEIELTIRVLTDDVAAPRTAGAPVHRPSSSMPHYSVYYPKLPCKKGYSNANGVNVVLWLSAGAPRHRPSSSTSSQHSSTSPAR